MAARSVGEKAGSTSLVERLAFYESYHGNFWNKVIHVVCIPLIVWGVLVALCKVPLLGTNLGALTTAAYCAMYTLADPASGLTWGAFVSLPLYSSAIKAVVALGPTASNLWGLAAFVFGFYFQVHVGHMVFEKRKPALVDGFVEAMLAAPLFVWLEVLFFLGFKKDLQATVEKRAAILLAQAQKSR